MLVVTSRANFEALTDLRPQEAKLPLGRNDQDGAHYLVGHAAQFALEVRFIAHLMKSNSFPKKKFAGDFSKHEPTPLRELAELNDDMDRDPIVCCLVRRR